MGDRMNFCVSIGGKMTRAAYERAIELLEELSPDETAGFDLTTDCSYYDQCSIDLDAFEKHCVENGVAYELHSEPKYSSDGDPVVVIWKPGFTDKLVFHTNSSLEICFSQSDLVCQAKEFTTIQELIAYAESLRVGELELVD